MYIFLSPHFDDAVYSCGGTIHQLTQRGETVLILTIMGGDPPQHIPDTPILRDLHQRWDAGEAPIAQRKEEDREAALRLGAQIRHINIPDCVYRVAKVGDEALYPSEESLWNHIHPDDWAVDELLNSQFPMSDVDLTKVKALYAPLGAGGHVDHLIVVKVALQKAVNAHYDVFFYEDYPYSDEPDSVVAALNRLPDNVLLEPVKIHLTEGDIAAKIEGVKAYRSQISTFWENESALEARVRESLFQGGQTPTEHFHRLSDSKRRGYS